MTYSEKLKDPRWQKKRLKILERDNYTCQNCHDTETELQVHHKKYNFGVEIWDYKNSELITFCKNCHKDVTELKKQIKSIIDECFVYTDDLCELHGILCEIYKYNPYDLVQVSKFCISYSKKKNKLSSNV